MAGSLPAAGSGSYEYLWQQSGDNTVWLTSQGSIYNEMGHQSAALATRQYFRRIVYSSPSGHECSDTSNTVEIRINPLPTGDVVSDVDTLCAGETLYVRFNVSGIHGPFDVNIDGSLRTGVTNSPDSVAFSPVISDQFTMVSVVDDSGCVADPAAFIGVAKAVVYEVPVANAGLDDDACSLQYTLQASKSVAGSEGFWISPGVTFDDPTLENANASVDGYGDRVLTWTETNWRCTDNDEVRIVFYEQPQVPDAGPDQVLDFTYTTQLQASTPSVGNGSWIMVAGSGNFSNNNQPDAVVNGLEDSNLLRWTVINGSCPAVSDSMMITVSPLEIPKGFTPNGDNKNDYFNLGAVNAEHIRIQIFNSAGVLVYESDNYLEGNLWDGYNMSQVELPEGTYFYIANIRVAGSDKEFQFRSFVEILR
jgi:gliding motility-associated-like protein